MKKLFALALAAMLALSAVGALAQSAEPAKFSIWSWLGSAEGWGAESLEQVACFQEAEKATNTDIEWVIESDTSTFDLMMSSGDTTDGIYYAWNPVRTATYSAAGLIVDIYPLIKEHMPNLSALIEGDPLVKKQLVSADGGIYFVPWLTTSKELVFGEGFAIRQDWLTKLGLTAPKTSDELYTVLKAFRDQDANGDGQNNEIVTGYPAQINRLTYAFGTSTDWHYLADGKTVVYGPATDNFKSFLKFMNQLYVDGILDPDYFSNDSDLYMKKCQENVVSLYCDNPAVFSTVMKDGAANGTDMDYEPIAYLQYNGASANLSSATRRYVQPYGVAIAASCADAGRFLEYFDYYFTPAGNDLLNWGVKDVSYTEADGVKTFTDAVMKDPNYAPSVALSKYALPTFVGVQSADADAALLGADLLKFKQTWAESDTSMAIEPFIAFSAEEQEVNTAKLTDLNTAAASWRDKFITGEKSIENDWQAYLDELNAYGVADLQAVRQAASDRYQAK